MKDRKKNNMPYKAQRESKNQERERADKLGGKVVRGSGCGNEKGDVRVHGLFRCELKCTEKKSFSLKLEDLQKIEDQALQCGEWPIFEVRYLTPYKPVDYVVIPAYLFDLMQESYSK